MTELLIDKGTINSKNVDHLIWLVKQAKQLGVVYIVLPFVDRSSLKTKLDLEKLISLLKNLLPQIESLGVELHLEADLIPTEFRKVFEKVNHPLLRMNYDIGNSASLGYDVDEEMKEVGPYLGSVHIKDRLFQGGTVLLGTGNADLSRSFKWFSDLNYKRWYVLQAARSKEGEEVTYIASVIKKIKEIINGLES